MGGKPMAIEPLPPSWDGNDPWRKRPPKPPKPKPQGGGELPPPYDWAEKWLIKDPERVE